MAFARASRLAVSAAVGGGVALSAALVALPAAADGDVPESTVFRTSTGSLGYVGAGEEDVLVDAAGGRLVLLAKSTVPVSAGAGCVDLGDTRPAMYKFDCGVAPAVTSLRISLGGGTDSLRWFIPVTGTVRGGDGSDTFTPAPGHRGSTLASSVTIIGGGDHDTVNYSQSTAAVSASLDGSANDGRRFLDSDTIGTDVEHLTGSPFADVLNGSAGRNILIGGTGSDVITTGGANDTISIGDDFPDTVHCAADSPSVTFASNDTIDILVGCRHFGG